MKPIVIIKAGCKLKSLKAHPGDFEDWISSGLQTDRPIQVVAVAGEQALPEPDQLAAVIVTGSSAMVTDKDPWISQVATWLGQIVECGLPVLGICFGHQLLAHALGGQVDNNPNGIEVGSVALELTAAGQQDPLLGRIPPDIVQVSHRQAVLQLPSGAIRLAHTRQDPNHAYRFGEQAWGIQFHPEFDETITRAYIEYYRPDLEQAGVDVDTISLQCRLAEAAQQVLQQFSQLI